MRERDGKLKNIAIEKKRKRQRELGLERDR